MEGRTKKGHKDGCKRESEVPACVVPSTSFIVPRAATIMFSGNASTADKSYCYNFVHIHMLQLITINNIYMHILQ